MQSYWQKHFGDPRWRHMTSRLTQPKLHLESLGWSWLMSSMIEVAITTSICKNEPVDFSPGDLPIMGRSRNCILFAFYSYEVLVSGISSGKLNLVDSPPLSGAAGGRRCCWGLRVRFFRDTNAFLACVHLDKVKWMIPKHLKIDDNTWIGGCMPLSRRWK